LPNNIVTDLKQIASNTARQKGFEVEGVQIHTHLSPLCLQVRISHIDRTKDVSLNDCALLTNPIHEAIENSQILHQSFVLEISSSGISELLNEDRDFKTFKGFPVEVTYQTKKKQKKVDKGLLHERSPNHLKINLKGKINRIPRDDVIKVRLATTSG